MTILRLYLDRGWPDSHPDLAWSLVDRLTGQKLRSGQGLPSTWPGATYVELMIPVGQTLFTQAALPNVPIEKRTELVGFAIEDKLINDPSSHIYAIAGRGSKGESLIAAVDANQVRRAVLALKQLRRLVDRIVPEECLLPPPTEKDGCAIWPMSKGWVIRGLNQPIIFIPNTPLEADFLERVWAQQTPAYLDVYQEAADRQDIPLWDGETRYQQPLDWQQGVTHDIYNFAIGGLAANRRWLNLVKLSKRSAKISLIFAALYFTTLMVQVAYCAWEKYAIQASIKSSAKPYLTVNNVPANDVPLVLLKAVDKIRVSHGLPPREGLLPAMLAFQSAVGDQMPLIIDLRYEAGLLIMTIGKVSNATSQAWQQKLAAQGWTLSKRPAQQDQQEWILKRSL